MLDFGIAPGETENCDPIEGYVKFSQTGFRTSGTPVNWLTTTFDCDFVYNRLTADALGEFTCSGTNGASPVSSVITVVADAANAEAVGIVTNTLSISLFADD